MQPEYALGDADSELQRLVRQSALYAELTEDLLRRAGLRPGMRVLDAGCGAGCVSLLAGRLVGPSGRVVGVDSSPAALALARRRAAEARMPQLSFIQGGLDDLHCDGSFDALIGRFVLMYLEDPAAVLRKLAQHVRAGGIIAFQEMHIAAAGSIPDMPLWQQCGSWIVETFRRAHVDVTMGPSLHAVFRRADLPRPQMQLQARVGCVQGLSAPEYLAGVVASLLPVMERCGVATAATVDIPTLAARLEQEMLREDGVMIFPPVVGAWTRRPAESFTRLC